MDKNNPVTDVERKVANGQTVRVGNVVYAPAGSEIPKNAYNVNYHGDMVIYNVK
jgi:hypothetical protein